MLFWIVALPLLWLRPKWALLAILCVVQIFLLFAFVGASAEFYRNAIARYPEVMGERWASLLMSIPLNVASFALIGSAVVFVRKRVGRNDVSGSANRVGHERLVSAVRSAEKETVVDRLGLLSGWVRLWIVGAVLMWAGGAWWLQENWPARYREPYACTFDGPHWGEPSPQELADHEACLQAEGRHYLENKAAIDAATAEREREYQWRVGSRIAAIIIAPLIAGAVAWFLAIVALWVARGFRRNPARLDD